MNHGQMRRYIDAPVLHRRRQCKPVVVLVNRAADRTEAVMTIGKDIGQRKGRHAACPRRLNDADTGNIVAGEAVEGKGKPPVVTARVMRGKNPVGDRFGPACGLRGLA